MLDLSIIVVSYHNAQDLPGLIASVNPAVGKLSWHATIVNNAGDEDLSALLADADRVSIVDSGGNLGYSGGINTGLAHAPLARVTVFLNPDLALRPDSMTLLVDALETAGAAVPRIVDAQGHRQDSLRREPTILRALGEAVFGDAWPKRPAALSETVRDPADYEHPHTIDWATGAVLAIRRDVLEAVGPWDDARFFMYSEETDYARRIREQKRLLLYVPESAVTHRAGGSGSSPQLDALLEVNKVRYYRKWHGPVAAAVFRLIVLLRNLVRPHRPGARAAVRALVSRRTRDRLPGGHR
ncbi:glycosyltransferase family 2 protein [Microbacterium sp.]|uniref:glycosyltransferase family 2 protein n=1 Tax=Microbacterium sp. TaxID=51671 RepID=UPI003A93EC43